MNAPLKRHPALIPLSHDHQASLLLAMILKKETPNTVECREQRKVN